MDHLRQDDASMRNFVVTGEDCGGYVRNGLGDSGVQ